MKRYGLLVLTLMLSTLLLAQGPGRRAHQRQRTGDGDRLQRGPEMWIDRLDLNDDQKNKMETLRIEHLQGIQVIQSDLKIREAELDAAITSENPDEKRIDQLVEQIADLQGKHLAAGVSHRLKVRAMLTDKQKVQFDHFHKQGFAKRPHRGGRHGFK